MDSAATVGAFVRAERERRGWSQDKLAARAKTSRQTIYALEKDGSGKIETLMNILSALGVRSFVAPGKMSRIPDLLSPDAAEVMRSIDTASRSLATAKSLLAAPLRKREDRPTPEGARVLRLLEPTGPRILFDEEQEQIDALKRAIADSPTRDIEWRTAFRGRGTHKVPRVGDAAAGFGAEPSNAIDENDVVMREIPEHYWDLGARVVMRVRGDSLSGLGYVDRDLLFVKPSTAAENNDIIVCTYQNLVYVKVLRRKPDRAWLLSANPEFRHIQIAPGEPLRVHGMVIGRSGYARPGSDLPDPDTKEK